ncbi:hypothetical protein Tco_1560036, partial [Tanacetum coccineum]
VQDACVSELLDVVKDDVNVNSVVKEEIVKDDVNVNSLVKEDIEKDDLHVDSFVKEDIEKDYVQFDSVVKDAEKRHREIKLEKDVTHSPTAPKRTVSVPEEINVLFCDKNRMEMKWTFPWEPNADWAMATPYLCDMFNILFITLMVSNMVSPGLQTMFKRCTFPSKKRILIGYLESCTLVLV